MSATEKRITKVIWRALRGHVKAGHRLEVRRMPDDEDLEIICSLCTDTVIVGSPIFVRQIVEELDGSGVKIDDWTRPVIEAV